MSNQLWQADFTHWSLADRTGVEILTFLDGHSPYAIACTAHRVTTVVAVLPALQTQIDAFPGYDNTVRSHRSLDRATPATAYRALPKATPTGAPTGWRIRTDRVGKNGRVAVHLHSRLHHIGIGRTYARTLVKMFLHGRHVLIIDPATGLVLRDVILDPTKDYQPRSLDQPPETEKHPGP
ncbi:hypothetical protein [Kocuria rosea]|uniref:hypothetical protein n=1 Tax=Kocuria rosea TaxID=1275 RepID=UPI0025415CDF|nr:hypothetical protein [Kocuria rosea]WIG19133.1 hypothetical protein QOY29_13350 [Kocuria rosea]